MASQRFPASQKIHPSHSRAPSLHSNAPWTALLAGSIHSSPERRLTSSALLPPSLFVQLARSGLVAAPRADRKKRTEAGRQDRLDNQLVCYSWNYPISQLYFICQEARRTIKSSSRWRCSTTPTYLKRIDQGSVSGDSGNHPLSFCHWVNSKRSPLLQIACRFLVYIWWSRLYGPWLVYGTLYVAPISAEICKFLLRPTDVPCLR